MERTSKRSDCSGHQGPSHQSVGVFAGQWSLTQSAIKARITGLLYRFKGSTPRHFRPSPDPPKRAEAFTRSSPERLSRKFTKTWVLGDSTRTVRRSSRRSKTARRTAPDDASDGDEVGPVQRPESDDVNPDSSDRAPDDGDVWARLYCVWLPISQRT